MELMEWTFGKARYVVFTIMRVILLSIFLKIEREPFKR